MKIKDFILKLGKLFPKTLSKEQQKYIDSFCLTVIFYTEDGKYVSCTTVKDVDTDGEGNFYITTEEKLQLLEENK